MLAVWLLFVVKVASAALFPATISPNEEAWPFRTTPACPVPLTGFTPLAVSCTSADLRHKKWHPRDHKTTEPYSRARSSLHPHSLCFPTVNPPTALGRSEAGLFCSLSTVITALFRRTTLNRRDLSVACGELYSL
jgi:hypothetical protein